MKRRSFLSSLIATATALPLAACFGSDNVTKRIKIIAKAEVDGKPVEGSTVMEITWRPRSDGGMVTDQFGEALVLDLAGRETVFVLDLLISDKGRTYGLWPNKVLKLIGLTGAAMPKHLQDIKELRGRFEINPVEVSNSLTFVAFKNESDFRSIYKVLPNEFERHFGDGTKFIGLFVEITNDPITQVLKHRLPVLLEKPQPIPDIELHKQDGSSIQPQDRLFKYAVSPNHFFAPGQW